MHSWFIGDLYVSTKAVGSVIVWTIETKSGKILDEGRCKAIFAHIEILTALARIGLNNERS